LTSLGGTDGFLAKYSPAGTLLWARRFGGTLDERVTDLAVDQAGNLYVGGGFEGAATFDPGGSLVLTSAGGSDGFITRYSTDGTLGWAVRFGGSGLDDVSALAVDAGGTLYAGGGFAAIATALPTSGVSIQSAGGRDGFILSMTTAGAVNWAIPVGGPQDDVVRGIAPSPTGLLLVAGMFGGTADFSRGGGSGPFLTSLGSTDIFLAAFTPIGLLLRATSFGGSSDETLQPGGLSLDGVGNTILLGNYAGSVDFDPGAGVAARGSLSAADLFANRFDPSGNFVSVITLGGTGVITPARVSFALDGGVAITGSFSGPIDFDPSSASSVLASLGLQGVTDAFVARFTASGALSWADRFGEATALAGRGSGGTGLGFDGAGNLIVAGYFTGNPDVDPGGTMFRLTNLGEADGFILKLTSNGALAP
jgi:hypothetical protein